MNNNTIKTQSKRLYSRIKKLERFINSLEGATDLSDVDHKEIKHLIYMVKCQKERYDNFVQTSMKKEG